MPLLSLHHPASLALAAALTCACAPVLAQGSAAGLSSTPVPFDIAAKPLGQALGEWALQTGMQLIVQPALVSGKTAPAVSGSLAPWQALNQLLAGSGLTARVDGAAVVVQEAAAASSSAATLPEVKVTGAAARETATGPVTGYVARQAATATKTDTPLIETPQSITVVTRDQMVDQNATNLQAALTYAAGVRSDAWGVDQRGDAFTVRGSTPTTYLDGLQQFTSGWYDMTTRVDPYMLERVEVLRGPAGMLFGAGTAAGVVNLVSKRPLQEAQREVGVSLGNFRHKQVQLDFTGPLTDDGQWSYRLIALRRDAGTQTDYVPDDRSLFVPSLTWRPGAATSVTLQALWQQDKSGSTAQYLPWVGTLLPNPNGQLPSSRFIGEPGDYRHSTRRSVGWQLEHQFNDRWTFRQAARLASNSLQSSYHYNGFWNGWDSDPIGLRLLEQYFNREEARTRVTGIDNHLQGQFDTGPVRHTLLVGADYSRQRHDSTWADSVGTLIDAYAPVYGAPPPALEWFTDPRIWQRNAGVYLQDQLRWGDWIAVAGLRHDRSTAEREGSDPDTTRANSRRLGVMYAFPAGWSPYLSYTESFTPQSGRTEEGDLFKPLRGKQVEAGVKYEPKDGGLSAALAVYRLREENRTINDPDNPDFGLQVDQSKNRGIEADVKVALTPALDVLAYYTHSDVDRKLGGVPRNQAAVWGKFRFAVADRPGFSVGGGVRYLSAYHDTTEFDTGPRIPSVTVFDLMLAYDTASWRAALNINNAADRAYLSHCAARGDCWWGPRRTVMASVAYRF